MLDPAILQHLVDRAPVLVVVLQPDGTVRHVNETVVRVTGYPREALLGRDWIEAMVPESERPRLRGVLDDSARGSAVRGNVNGIRTADGRILQVAWSDERVESDEDGPLIIAIGRDVTETRAAEERLQRSEARLREAQALAHLGHWDLDLASDELTWSDEVYRIFGVDPDEAVPNYDRFLRAVHPEDRERVRLAFDRTVQQGEPYDLRHRIMRPDGTVRVVTERGRVHRDAHGRAVRALGTVQDVTESFDANARLRRVLDGVHAYVGLFDLQGRILEVNAAPLAGIGLSRDEVIGQVVWEAPWFAWDADLQASLRDAVLRAGRGEHVRLDLPGRVYGEARTFDMSFGPLTGLDGRIEGVVASAMDQTDRLRAEDEVRRAAEALADAELLARIGSWEVDLQTGEVRGSDGLYRLLGVDPADGLAVDAEGLQAILHPDDLARAAERWIDVQGDAGRFDPTEPRVYRVRHADGHWLSCVIVSRRVPGPDGRAVLRGFIQDVTEVHEARQRIEAQLAEKEVLLREIHHRVKNNLQSVSSMVSLQRASSPDAAALADLEAQVRAMSLVHERLYEPSGDLARVDMGGYARDLVTGLRRIWGAAAARLTFDVQAPRSWQVDLDSAVPCGLILTELISNAIKHGFPDDRAGTVCVRIDRVPEGPCLEVVDDGVGLAAGASPSVGLLLIHRLAEQVGGTLTLDGGRGVRARLVLTPPSRSTGSQHAFAGGRMAG